MNGSALECEPPPEALESESKRRKKQKNMKSKKGTLRNEQHAQAELELPDRRGDEEEGQENHYGLQRGSHGYGIQPLGNLLLSTSGCNVRDVGLGTLQVLSDETICDILSNLDGRDLARLALVSKAFYVFAHQDSLWRNLVLDNYKGRLGFQGCWKTTYLASFAPNFGGPPHLPLKVPTLLRDLSCVLLLQFSFSFSSFLELFFWSLKCCDSFYI